MKISYDAEADALYIYLRPTPDSGVTTRQVSDDANLDYGPDGELVGIEVLNASAGEPEGRVVVDVAARPASRGRAR